MNLRLIIRAEARRDIEEAVLWYESERQGLGSSFLDDLNQLLERIANTPEQFPEIDKRLRRGLMRRFPYALYFCSSPARVDILAALHLKRRSGLWKDRPTTNG